MGSEFTDLEYELGDGPDFSTAAWSDARDSLGLDFPTLPYYIDGDVKLTDVWAILKYVALKLEPELLGSTLEQRAHVEMLANVLSELSKQSTIPCYFEGTDLEQLETSLLDNMHSLAAYMHQQGFSFLVAE